METPKSRKQRITKGLSKKRRNLSNGGVSDSKGSTHEAGSSDGSSPVKTVLCPNKTAKIVEREREEIGGVEWEFRNWVEADAPVVWGSPQGSPIINTVRSSDSPVTKSRNIGHSLKHLNYTEYDPPEFLNEMVALCERIKAPEGDETKTKNDNNLEGLPNADHNLDESYSNLFDESMNEYLIQCSQEQENNSKPIDKAVDVNCDLHEPEKTKNVPKCITSNRSPRKKLSQSSGSNTASSGDPYNWSDRSSPRVGNKNYLDRKKKATTYVYKGRVLGVRKSSVMNCTKSQIDRDVENKNKSIGVTQSCNNVGKGAKSPKCVNSNSATDPSWEKMRDWFFDDDEFMSSIPVDLGLIEDSNTTSDNNKIPVNSESTNHQKDLSSVCTAFDDSAVFGDGVLELLDSIESSAVPSCTEKVRCTPEEIEKKRQEAKSKLEKKKKLNLRNRNV